MGIDYIVDLDCPAKQSLTVEKMVALIKGKNQAMAIMDISRRQGDKRPPEQLTFTRMLLRPEGPVEETVSVGTLLKQVKELQPQERHCQGCKANVLGHPFGCYGSISYPITPPAEQWLMALLPDDLNTASGHLLQSAVKDFKHDGGMFLKMRKQDMFFQSRQPVKRAWGSWFSKWSLTSDQLLQMLFGLGTLQPAHCQMMCIILGLITTDDKPRPLPQPSPNDQSIQVAQAINAVARAAQLGVDLLIDA